MGEKNVEKRQKPWMKKPKNLHQKWVLFLLGNVSFLWSESDHDCKWLISQKKKKTVSVNECKKGWNNNDSKTVKYDGFTLKQSWLFIKHKKTMTAFEWSITHQISQKQWVLLRRFHSNAVIVTVDISHKYSHCFFSNHIQTQSWLSVNWQIGVALTDWNSIDRLAWHWQIGIALIDWHIIDRLA